MVVCSKTQKKLIFSFVRRVVASSLFPLPHGQCGEDFVDSATVKKLILCLPGKHLSLTCSFDTMRTEKEEARLTEVDTKNVQLS